MDLPTIHVIGAIIIKDDKVFCAQRNEHASLPLKWEFPGGKVEANESLHHALQRELMEELGIHVAMNEDIYLEVSHTYDFATIKLTTIICRLQEQVPVLKEHINAKWLRLEDLLTLDWAPADIPIVEKLMTENIEDL